jgi:carbon storage regulator
MLIVTRRKGQRIVLGHDIEIVITDITRSGVKIGIVAPNSLTILRGEVRDAVEQANRDALDSSFADAGVPADAGAAEPAVIPAAEPPVPATGSPLSAFSER